MKRTLLLLISLVASMAAFAQYHPFLDNSAWNVRMYNFGGYSDHYIQPGTPVSVDGMDYMQFTDAAFGNQTVLIREDIPSKKVYRRIDGSDVLLYDFSLEVGDTFTLPNGQTLAIVEISEVPTADGGTTRRFFMNSFVFSEVVYEGVGGDNHPFRYQSEMPADPALYNYCSYQDGVNIFNFGLANGGTPTDCNSLGLPTSRIADVKLYPNPFSRQFTISNDSGFSDADIKLFDVTGREVRTLKHMSGNQIEIPRANLVSGIYALQIEENGKVISRKKLVVE
ncbi:T9SS type A sorting domain-containing protein [Flavobacterium sp. MAH-1]|uniref:T9SS type A sorting domain-containing protein n=1 Tax=Flavobacterium agri TaxID=2743471 RepID=A0A7Y8Y515_9FLAO|nr:T9SS type A sorting domain-containing protein [Flavobacterium agri]NUY82660.1 T9SS type A sorting domain-containing protein [Flavobacterium agri]NYA72683.1 T9SS type A sorting domain-containing protein [Flavobacterium agri]